MFVGVTNINLATKKKTFHLCQTFCLFCKYIFSQGIKNTNLATNEEKNALPLPPLPLSTASPVLAPIYKPEVRNLYFYLNLGILYL